MTNADRARRWFNEVWVAGGETTVNELMAEDIVGFMEGSDIHNRQEFHEERQRLLQVFSDLSVVVDDAIEQGSKVAVRWHVTARHTGNNFGFPATNMSVSFRGMSWIEFNEGRIVRGWDSWNLGHLLQTLQASRAAAG